VAGKAGLILIVRPDEMQKHQKQKISLSNKNKGKNGRRRKRSVVGYGF
jgi:hypothetical protein